MCKTNWDQSFFVSFFLVFFLATYCIFKYSYSKMFRGPWTFLWKLSKMLVLNGNIKINVGSERVDNERILDQLKYEDQENNTSIKFMLFRVSQNFSMTDVSQIIKIPSVLQFLIQALTCHSPAKSVAPPCQRAILSYLAIVMNQDRAN